LDRFKYNKVILREVKGVDKMLSTIPIDLKKVDKANIDKEVLRVGIIAELDAVSLYEQLAAMTGNADIKKILLDIAKEEKTHVGEFQTMLLKLDKEQVKELEEGKKEVEEMTK
jgi:rubrerythrin